MPRGIKGSGKPRKVSNTAALGASGDAPVKKTRRPRQPRIASNSIFGEHDSVIKAMKARAELATILEKHLKVLADDLAKIDAQNGSALGKRILEKVTAASIDALIQTDHTRAVLSKNSNAYKKAMGFFDQTPKKAVGES